MQALYEVFLPNMMGIAKFKNYKRGEVFELINKAAFVVSGVFAIDARHTPMTLRLASFGDILNLERIVKFPTVEVGYKCESLHGQVAEIPLAYFEEQMRSESPEVRNAMSQYLLSQTLRFNTDFIETLCAVREGTAIDKVVWALERFRKISEDPIQTSRLASHIGVAPETASRAFSQFNRAAL